MKPTDIKRLPLADTVLAALAPEAKDYYQNYGADRLYFLVTSAGRERWVLRYKKPNGKWGWHGLGIYPDVSAKCALE